jgi:hypothetical protein
VRVVAAGTLVAVLFLLPVSSEATRFRLPLDDADGSELDPILILGCDHDPVDYGGSNTTCLSYDGNHDFPFCYDQHHGRDLVLMGGFPAMDAGSVAVVAAAGGEVFETRDGNYDRCHFDVDSQGVSCDGHPKVANMVRIRHADGHVTNYWHLMKGSILVKQGDVVTCGQPLALVGSSGISSFPHLHFQVEDATGAWVDPFAGPESQPESLWVQQDSPSGFPGAVCEEDWVPPPEPSEAAESGPEDLPVAELAVEASDAGADIPAAVDPGSDLSDDAPGPVETASSPDPGPRLWPVAGCAAGSRTGGAEFLAAALVLASTVLGFRRWRGGPDWSRP